MVDLFHASMHHTTKVDVAPARLAGGKAKTGPLHSKLNTINKMLSGESLFWSAKAGPFAFPPASLAKILVDATKFVQELCDVLLL